MAKEVRLNAFHMNAPGHSWPGLWAHPRDASMGHDRPEYWMELARTAERGLLDAVFLADVVGVYDVYAGTPDASLRAGAQAPSLDPFPVVPLMAAVTEHLGFGVTATLTYEQPYLLARRFSTLDHLTRGRMAWNIVTGLLDSGARGAGQTALPEHDDRYAAADEFMDVMYALWEGSWADDALLRDRASRVYVRPEGVRRIAHPGPRYPLDVAHLVHPSPQRTPFLFQAGASSAGRDFAARHAEAVFVNGHTIPLVRETVRDIRARAVAAGRLAEDIKVFLGATVILGVTDAEAQDRYAEYQSWIDVEGSLALLSGWSGIDLSRYGLDDPIRHVEGARDALVHRGADGAEPGAGMDGARPGGVRRGGRPRGLSGGVAGDGGGRAAPLAGRGECGRVQPDPDGDAGGAGGGGGFTGAGVAVAWGVQAGARGRAVAGEGVRGGLATGAASGGAASVYLTSDVAPR